ncbi:hypothetical protein ACFV16_39540 [Streptomyces massasporeus]|uniref:hypothetical protein n=1 Tax=Streptomyces massasporeus TaxID=67324 RepID=UPI003691A4B3
MGKTWLIIGSFRGLGPAIAEAVLEAGNDLVATVRRTVHAVFAGRANVVNGPLQYG